jgi:aryl-alcohol dehydrogenase-like predicted oxidoreductase
VFPVETFLDKQALRDQVAHDRNSGIRLCPFFDPGAVATRASDLVRRGLSKHLGYSSGSGWWSQDAMARQSFDPEEIAMVQSELDRIAAGEGKARPVRSVLRQLVATTIP